MPDEPSSVPPPYKIISVQKADPPPGAGDAVWHRYVISQGGNIIRGHRKGSRKSVTRAVEEVVAQLNERRLGKRGRVNLVPTPKKTPPKT